VKKGEMTRAPVRKMDRIRETKVHPRVSNDALWSCDDHRFLLFLFLWTSALAIGF
jgi:hypothetical protein